VPLGDPLVVDHQEGQDHHTHLDHPAEEAPEVEEERRAVEEEATASLGGNPPEEFNGERSKANAFMNHFNLYRLSNYDAEPMVVPMKHEQRCS
jgi:hypothetical protein